MVAVSILARGTAGKGRDSYLPWLKFSSAESFMVQLRNEWWPNLGRAVEISEPTTYPEFFTVDVTFRTTRGRTVERFLIPTKGPDA